jgi:WD40 repeat protein
MEMRKLNWLVALVALFFGQSAIAVPIAYITEFTNNKIIRFNLETGASEVFAEIPSFGDPDGARPRGVAVDNQGQVYAGLRGGTRNIIRYSQDGTFMGGFTESIGGFGAGLISFNDAGELVVAGDISSSSSVFRYDGATGQLIDSFNNPNISNVVGLTVLERAVFAAGIFDGDIVRYDLTQTPPVGELFISNAVDSSSRYQAIGVTVGHTGNLLVASWGPGNINEFDIDTGSFLGTFMFTETGVADFQYNAQTQEYYGTNGGSLFVYDTNGELLRTLSNPSLVGAVGIAFADLETVPEPTTLALFAAGLAGLGFSARRRKQAH